MTTRISGQAQATISSAGVVRAIFYNVRDTAYGAVADAQTVTDGAMTAASAVLTSAAGKFAAGDVGKLVFVPGAGAAGATLSTTIASHQSATQVTLTVAATTTVAAASVTWGTNDAAAIQAAITAAATAGGGIVFIPPGAYCVNTALIALSNVVVMGSGKGSTILKLGPTPPCMFVSISAISNVLFWNFTIDCNSFGSGINLTRAGTSSIHLNELIVKNMADSHALGLCWPVAIGGITGAAPGSGGSNIVIENCDIGSGAPIYESCIVLNSTEVRVVNNRFHDMTGNFGGGLAIYAYCRNVVVEGNAFSNCGGSGGFDCYLQQSDTITYANNVHFRSNGTGGVALSLLQAVNLVISDNAFMDTGHVSTGIFFGDITDGTGTSFNGNTNQYTASHDILIKGNRFHGHLTGIQVYSSPNPSPGIHAQTGVNNMSDITIADNEIDGMPAGGVGVQVGGATIQNIARIEVRNFKVNGACAYAPSGAGIVVRGNPGFTATTTTSAVTTADSVTQIAVTLAAVPAGLVVGQWISIDTAGSQEDVAIISVQAGVGVTAIFTKNHSSGVAVAISATVAASKGIGPVRVTGGTIAASTSSGSSSVGISLNNASNVSVENVDLSPVKAVSTTPISLTNGGLFTVARNNRGYNPVGPVGPPSVPASASSLTNPYGVDCLVHIATGAGVTISNINVGPPGATVSTGLAVVASSTMILLLAAGQAINLTYAGGTPSWVWTAN